MDTRTVNRLSLSLTSVLALTVLVGFYRPGDRTAVASARMNANPRTPTVEETRSTLLAEADNNYSYGQNRPSVKVDDAKFSGPGGVLPEMTIATARSRGAEGRIARNLFIARVISAGAYPTMGIAPGENFLWRDVSGVASGESVRTLVVPRDRSYPMVWLKTQPSAPGHDLPPEPRLVRNSNGYGGCDIVNCPLMHCEFRVRQADFEHVDVGTIQILRELK
jgi:hypothetical protein